MKHLSIMPKGNGHFIISADYYGMKRSATTTNTLAIDVYQSGEKSRFYTPKQAHKELLKEIRFNHFKR
jgi:hypothetical protein